MNVIEYITTVYLLSINCYICISLQSQYAWHFYAKVSGRSRAENLYYGKTQIDGT